MRLYYRRSRADLAVLLAAHSQPVNSYGGASHRAAEFEVVCNLGDIEKHFLQIAGYRDFFHGIGQFSTRNPESRSAPRIVAGHQVGSVSEKLGYVEAVFNLGDDLLRRLCPGLQKVI